MIVHVPSGLHLRAIFWISIVWQKTCACYKKCVAMFTMWWETRLFLKFFKGESGYKGWMKKWIRRNVSLTLNSGQWILPHLHFLPRGCKGEEEAEYPILFSRKRSFIRLQLHKFEHLLSILSTSTVCRNTFLLDGSLKKTLKESLATPSTPTIYNRN